MPRPSKHVSPDTLGGRIRAAREDLHLSLADVAGSNYSTSLISQIERNRVDPSQGSLRYLAERLHLPFEDLEIWAQQHRKDEVEARQYKSYEDLRTEAAQLFKNKDFQRAIYLLHDINFSQLPLLQRWRLAALRGHCYFEQKKFLNALQDFTYAVYEQPQQERLSADQQQEFILLHLHLAATSRELGLENAFEAYQATLKMMNHDTPFGYVAEAHWGMAVIAFTQAYHMREPLASSTYREQMLRTALEHAENARVLYRLIHESLQADLVLCHIAQIERELGHRDKVRRYMHELLESETNTPQHSNVAMVVDAQTRRSQASILSVASCTLATLALEDRDYEEASHYAELALENGAKGHLTRQVDAYIILGRILEAIHDQDNAEQAFKHAILLLADTDRIAARIQAHLRLARHFTQKGNTSAGNAEIDAARRLAASATPINACSTAENKL